MLRYNADWHDMSDYVVHFTRPTEKGSAYDNMMSIYFERVLRPGRAFGIARQLAPDRQSQFAVCFSEIPLHLLERLVERRGRYGIGFTKAFLLSCGGGPIWYVERGSPSFHAIFGLMNRALASPVPENDPIWRLTPFIDAPGDYLGGAYRFEWEREWRHVGEFGFSEQDPAFLIIPEKLHAQAKRFFEDAVRGYYGPGYFCPYIDPEWDRERIRDALTR